MISVEDVQRLLNAEDADATLVMIEGAPVVRSGEPAGLPVITRADLLEQAGERLDHPAPPPDRQVRLLSV